MTPTVLTKADLSSRSPSNRTSIGGDQSPVMPPITPETPPATTCAGRSHPAGSRGGALGRGRLGAGRAFVRGKAAFAQAGAGRGRKGQSQNGREEDAAGRDQLGLRGSSLDGTAASRFRLNLGHSEAGAPLQGSAPSTR